MLHDVVVASTDIVCILSASLYTGGGGVCYAFQVRDMPTFDPYFVHLHTLKTPPRIPFVRKLKTSSLCAVSFALLLTRWYVRRRESATVVATADSHMVKKKKKYPYACQSS
jgi:hypothetical protein